MRERTERYLREVDYQPNYRIFSILSAIQTGDYRIAPIRTRPHYNSHHLLLVIAFARQSLLSNPKDLPRSNL